MATIDLGKIKLVNRGAYNNATAYTVDDLVQSGGTTYICIQNSTGNAVTDTSYWSVLAQAGTDGTDVGTTITTQGDILYRDGSGLQRLAAGTAGQVLQTGGSGANPSWGTVSSDYVKLARYAGTSLSASSYNFQNIFDDTVYARYHFTGYSRKQGGQIRARYLNGSTAYTDTYGYHHGGFDSYRQVNNNGNAISASNDGDGRDYIILMAWATNNTHGIQFQGTIDAEGLASGKYKFSTAYSQGRDDSGTAYIFHTGYGHHTSFTGAVDGIQFYTSDSAGFGEFRITIYGEKK